MKEDNKYHVKSLKITDVSYNYFVFCLVFDSGSSVPGAQMKDRKENLNVMPSNVYSYFTKAAIKAYTVILHLKYDGIHETGFTQFIFLHSALLVPNKLWDLINTTNEEWKLYYT